MIAGDVVELAVAGLAGAEVDASVDRHRLALTRFANSVIHQNVAEDVTTMRVRVHHEGRTAACTGTVTDDRDLRRVVERALAVLPSAPLDPQWPGVAGPAVAPPIPAVDPAAAEVSAAARAQAVWEFVDGARGLETAGYVRTSHWTGSFASSAGQELRGEATELGMSGIARVDGADGVARAAPRSMDELDAGILGARAAAKASSQEDPVELPPGRYEVVLEPTAVADIVESLAGAGFNGRFVHQGQSFVRLGEQQFDPSMTFVDDPLAVGLTYDDDGSPRSRLTLVEDGTVVALTYDRRAAAEYGATSTGHAADTRFSFGPVARHLGLLPTGGPDDVAGEVEGPAADASVAELVAGVERGVLVSDFWYTRMLDPRSLAITGLTRNGIWLIEGGRITSPLRNFRFTQSYAQALMPGTVVGIGRVAAPIPGDTYTATSPRWSCPALHLASWNFTGGASG